MPHEEIWLDAQSFPDQVPEAMKPLPSELVSLVHHVQLNRSGWWDTAVERLVLAALWLSSNPVAQEDLAEQVQSLFGVRVAPEVLASRIDRLRSTNAVFVNNGRVKLSEERLKELEQDRTQGDQLVEATKLRFVTEIEGADRSLNGEELWESFLELWLHPTICAAGARTYELLAGNYADWTATATLDPFLDTIGSYQTQAVRQAVERFLDPRDPAVRAYMLRLMDAYFVVEASRLSEKTVQTLSDLSERRPVFTLFLDTNILFSLLGFHGDASRAGAQALLDLARDLNGRVNVRLYALQATIDETRAALQREMQFLDKICLSPQAAQAALLTGELSDVAGAYAEAAAKSKRTLTPSEFLSPYAQNLSAILRQRGVEIYQSPVGPILQQANVQDDVTNQVEFEKNRYGERAKSRTQIEHDVALWHLAHSKRSARVDSPTDANYWVVTEDYRLTGFDLHKRGGSRGAASEPVPVCLQPLALVQLLQFWTGRSEGMEEALLGGLRLSLLSGNFDPEAERATITILETLSRYENLEDLPREAVTHVLVNDALRQKLSHTAVEEERIDLVREELFAEFRRKSEGDQQAAAEALSHEQNLRRLQNDEHLAERISALEKERSLSGRLAELEQSERGRIAEEMARSAAREKRSARRRYVLTWLVLPAAVGAGLQLLVLWILSHFTHWTHRAWLVELPMSVVLASLWLLMATRTGAKNSSVAGWWVHRWISGVKAIAITLILAILYGVSGNIVTEGWWKPLAAAATDSTLGLSPMADSSHVRARPRSPEANRH